MASEKAGAQVTFSFSRLCDTSQCACRPGFSVPCGLWHEVTDKLDVFFDDALFTSRVVLIWDSLSVLILLVSEPRVILVSGLVCNSFAR